MLSIKSLLPPPKKFISDPIAPLGIRPVDDTNCVPPGNTYSALDRYEMVNELEWMKQNLPSHPLIGKTVATVPLPVAVPGTVASSPNISAIPVVADPTPTRGRVRSPAEQFEVEDVEEEIVPEYPPEPYNEGFVGDDDIDFEALPSRRF